MWGRGPDTRLDAGTPAIIPSRPATGRGDDLAGDPAPASEHRNAISRAASSGSPQRPNGSSRQHRRVGLRGGVAGVGGAGIDELTVIRLSATATERLSVSWCSAPLPAM